MRIALLAKVPWASCWACLVASSLSSSRCLLRCSTKSLWRVSRWIVRSLSASLNWTASCWTCCCAWANSWFKTCSLVVFSVMLAETCSSWLCSSVILVAIWAWRSVKVACSVRWGLRLFCNAEISLVSWACSCTQASLAAAIALAISRRSLSRFSACLNSWVNWGMVSCSSLSLILPRSVSWVWYCWRFT